MTEQELRQHRCCFTGHRPENLDRPEADVIEGLKKKSVQLLLTDFEHSYPEWHEGSISGQQKSCWPSVTRARQSGSSAPAHTKDLRVGGVGSGGNSIAGS